MVFCIAFLYFVQNRLRTTGVVGRSPGFAKKTSLRTSLAGYHDGEIFSFRRKLRIKFIGQKVTRRMGIKFKIRILFIRCHFHSAVFPVNQSRYIRKTTLPLQFLKQPRHGVICAVVTTEVRSIHPKGLRRVNPEMVSPDDHVPEALF